MPAKSKAIMVDGVLQIADAGDVAKKGRVTKHGTTGKIKFKLTDVLPGYGNTAAAEMDCGQLKHPNVFQNRSAIFPNPRNFSVDVTVLDTEVVRFENPVNPLNPFGVKFTIEIIGERDRAERWADSLKDRIRFYK